MFIRIHRPSSNMALLRSAMFLSVSSSSLPDEITGSLSGVPKHREEMARRAGNDEKVPDEMVVA